MKLKAVVVDDEPLARKGIKSFVDKIDFLEFAGEAKDIEGLVMKLNETTVDVVFMDIEMPGLSGMDFVKTYENKLPLIIFITAYHDFAVESYAVHAVDYLLKPVSFERFYDAATKALEIKKSEAQQDGTDHPFFVRHEGQFQKVNPKEIRLVTSMQNYIRVYQGDAKPIVVRNTLKEFHQRLNPNQFLFVHKSHVVNRSFIDSITASHVNLSEFGQIPIGRKYKDELMKILLD